MVQYDDLAYYYEILYAGYDKEVLQQQFLDTHRALFEQYPSPRIHDTACGNGVQAIALARAGFTVTASDLSGEMVRLTREYAVEQAVGIEVSQKSWNELIQEPEGTYDLLLCIGNSISHCKDRWERKEVLAGFFQLLRPGGTLLLDTRNWDYLSRIDLTYQVLPLRRWGGKAYIPLYLWDEMVLSQPSRLRIIFIQFDGLDGKEQTTVEKQLSFTPFGHQELIEDCKNSGFVIDKDSFTPEGEEYFLYVRRE